MFKQTMMAQHTVFMLWTLYFQEYLQSCSLSVFVSSRSPALYLSLLLSTRYFPLSNVPASTDEGRPQEDTEELKSTSCPQVTTEVQRSKILRTLLRYQCLYALLVLQRNLNEWSVLHLDHHILILEIWVLALFRHGLAGGSSKDDH